MTLMMRKRIIIIIIIIIIIDRFNYNKIQIIFILNFILFY